MQMTGTCFSLPIGVAPELKESGKLYTSLMRQPLSPQSLERACCYLEARVEEAEELSCDLPDSPDGIPQWIHASTQAVGSSYQAYLAKRQAGEGRLYFKTKSHALNFLRCVAPTKLVDGAWLYGLTSHWQDARFANLIRIYLEELGEGIPEKNHVAIYKKLLAANACDQWGALDDQHYVQGAIQLSLAHAAPRFLPELIGFNLGYEQLPLHLLICAYELNELGIDPYYFTLHVTVDNAATGHAHRAFQALQDAMPTWSGQDDFYRRVNNGYKLNMLGASTLSVIRGFDLDDAFLSVLEHKSSIGAQLHSDYCRIGGRTVNQWLSDPDQLPEFVFALESSGWIKRHQPAQDSRFWNLIEGEQAPMFGVFDAYERQVIHDWIAGDHLHLQPGRALNYRARQRLLGTIAKSQAGATPAASQDRGENDFDAELRQLEEKLAALTTEEERMAELIPLLSPSRHHTAAGLMATRIYTSLFNHGHFMPAPLTRYGQKAGQ